LYRETETGEKINIYSVINGRKRGGGKGPKLAQFHKFYKSLYIIVELWYA
jgi:hypothetical protein